MPIDPITMGIQAGASLISGVTGIIQGAKARKMERDNVRPTYNTPNEIKRNQRMAEMQATQGLPGQQLMQGYQKIGRNANAALSAAQDRRGGLASIGSIQQASNDASLNLNVADANARMSNIRNLMAQNDVMAQYRDKAWQWNTQQKYLDNAAAVRALKGASNANINSSLQGLMSMGAGMMGGGIGGKALGGQAATASLQGFDTSIGQAQPGAAAMAYRPRLS